MIWWATATPHPAQPAAATSVVADKEAAAATAATPPEVVLPRGGALRGAVSDANRFDAIRALTGATLVRVNRSTDQLEPSIAESWTASSRTTRYTVKLRADGVWRDGSPLTADDVVASIDRAALKINAQPVRASATGPLEVELAFPSAFAPGMRLFDDVPIVSRTGVPDGLGPYLLVTGAPTRAAAHRLDFARNPRYWRKAPDGQPLPYVDTIALEVNGNAHQQLAQFLGGFQDYVDQELAPDDFATLKRADQDGKALMYDMGPGVGVDVLMPDARSRWLAREELRLAISAAIDRRALCQTVYGGACDPSSVPVSTANITWFSPDVPMAAANPEAARTLIAALGLQDRNKDGMVDGPDGRPLTLQLAVDRRHDASARGAAFVKSALAAVGLAVTVIDRAGKAVPDFTYTRTDPRDADPALDSDFWKQPAPDTDWQRSIDTLMAKQAASSDKVERLQAFADVQKLYAMHMPVVALATPHQYAATSPHLMNAKPSRQRLPLLWNAELLALQPAK